MRQAVIRKTSVIAVEVSKQARLTSKPGQVDSPGMSLAGAADWPGGVRHRGDVSLICGFYVEREKAHPDTVVPSSGGVGEREFPKRRKP